ERFLPERQPAARRHGFTTPEAVFDTVRFTIARCESCPSVAVATSVYFPGVANRAVAVAEPFVTAIDPAGSKVTFAGPPYWNQLTARPRGREPPTPLV